MTSTDLRADPSDRPDATIPSAAAPLGPRPEEGAADETTRVSRPWWSGPAPLLPAAGATGAPMTAVIAIISALAALSLAAFILIASATARWTDDLAASMTVQVKGADAIEIEARTNLAMAVLQTTPGLTDIAVKSPTESARLLEPWLGAGADTYLSVPALIEMRAGADARENVESLRSRLAAASEGLSLDDHGGWNASLARTARTGQFLAFAVFVLITGAACAVAAFAARAGLAANADVVSLLHLVGATDDFVANEVQRRFVLVGLRGAFIGVAIAVVVIALAALATRARGEGEYFIPVLNMDVLYLAPMAAVPLAISLATAVTARLTVLKALRRDL